MLYKSDSILNAIYNDKKLKIMNNINNRDTNAEDLNAVENNLNDIFNEGLNLFHRHYDESIKYLNLLKNDHSQLDAFDSLQSILNIMKSTLD